MEQANAFIGNPDVDVRVSIKADPRGNISNFFVSWPGFILFTHAWLGYGYDIDYSVRCIVSHPTTGEKISEFTEPIHLHLRHADFDRTWAAGCGWLFLYTATAFVNGFYVMTYDDDITPLLYDTAYPVLADGVAKRIISAIKGSDKIQTYGANYDLISRGSVATSLQYEVINLSRDKDNGFAYAFKFRLKNGVDGGLFAVNTIKQELRQAIAAEYISAYGGNIGDVRVDFPEFSMADTIIEGRAEVMRISVVSLQYDATRRKGVISVKIGANRFEDARKWVRKNIETLAKDKNIALTTGTIPPETHFFLGAERVKEGGVLEIEFETE